MRAAFIIARRELRSLFRTPLGHGLLTAMLFAEAFLFEGYVLGGETKLTSEVVAEFFTVTAFIALGGGALIALRLIAEERLLVAGTILKSAPLSERVVISGKFLAGVIFLGIFLVATSPLIALLSYAGTVSTWQVATGYGGALLVGSFGAATGALCASLAERPLAASAFTVMTLLILSTSWLVGTVSTAPFLGAFAVGASWWTHFEPFREGLLDTSHVGYFALAIAFMLFTASRALEASRWR